MRVITVTLHQREDGVWYADCKDDHGRGATPGEAVDRLVQYLQMKRAKGAKE